MMIREDFAANRVDPARDKHNDFSAMCRSDAERDADRPQVQLIFAQDRLRMMRRPLDGGTIAGRTR